MRSNSNIIFFTPAFPGNEQDTIITPPVYLLALNLLKIEPNLDITILTLHLPAQSAEYEFKGLKVIALGAGGSSYPKRFWYWFKAAGVLTRLHQDKPIHLIQTFWLNECALIADRFARKNRIPHINTLMGQDVLPSNKFLRFFKRATFATVAISKMQIGLLKERGVKPPKYYIPWGFDSRNETATNTNRPIDIIALGSFISLKRMQDIPSLIQKLELDTGKPYAIALVGDGPLKSRVEQQVQALNLKSNITFYGSIEREQVLRMFEQSKVLVHPSDYEGCSMTILEALGKGCKVACRHVGYANDVENTYLRKVKQVEDLVEPIKELLVIEKVNPVVFLDMLEVAQRYVVAYEEEMNA